MKKIIFSLLIFICINPLGAQAAEIFGKISTNPADMPDISAPISEKQNQAPDTADIKKTAVLALPILPVKNNENASAGDTDETIKVLGVKYFPEHSLLRGPDKKIYLLEGNVKKYIANLAELKKYQGKIIFSASAEDLSRYQTRAHLNKDLIREKGTVKVYAIKDGKRKHILNLEELFLVYFGQEIFNITSAEMALY